MFHSLWCLAAQRKGMVITMSIQKEWLDFLREQYPVGSRIKVRTLGEGAPDALKPGATGALDRKSVV